jgi:hypothetical protein
MTARLRPPLSLYHMVSTVPYPVKLITGLTTGLKVLTAYLNLDQGIRLRAVLLSLEWVPLLSILQPTDHSCLLTGIH